MPLVVRELFAAHPTTGARDLTLCHAVEVGPCIRRSTFFISRTIGMAENPNAAPEPQPEANLGLAWCGLIARSNATPHPGGRLPLGRRAGTGLSR